MPSLGEKAQAEAERAGEEFCNPREPLSARKSKAGLHKQSLDVLLGNLLYFLLWYVIIIHNMSKSFIEFLIMHVLKFTYF